MLDSRIDPPSLLGDNTGLRLLSSYTSQFGYRDYKLKSGIMRELSLSVIPGLRLEHCPNFALTWRIASSSDLLPLDPFTHRRPSFC
jgi:hypothetical protein